MPKIKSPHSRATPWHAFLRLESLFGLLFVLAVCGLLWSWPSHTLKPPQPSPSIPRPRVVVKGVALVVMGPPLAIAWRRAMAQTLARSFGLSVRWLPRRPLPAEAWHPLYKRHRAGRLCQALARWRPPETRWIIGVTTADISARQPGYSDHAVFGLADVRGPAAVLSAFRLKGLREQEQLPIWRRLVLHEAGHLFGLPHCPKPRCPMFAAEASLPRLRNMGLRLCRACALRLGDVR